MALSDGLLADLGSADPGLARFYGRDAAYLKLHYGEMTDPEIDRLLNSLMAGHANGATPFSYAYYLSKLGYDAAGAKMGSRLNPPQSWAHDLTAMRALANAGRFDVVVNAERGAEEWWGKNYLIPTALAFVDKSPEERKRLADIADQGGARVLAGELYASLPDYEAWKGFLKRNFTKIDYRHLKGSFVVFSAYNYESPPVPDPRNQANGMIFRQFVQTISAASWLLPESALLYEFAAHFKFEPMYARRAALTLKQAYDRGELRPDGPVEKGWLLTYRALAAAADDPRIIVTKMQQVHIASHHYLEGSAGDILDTMLATEAIGPWLRGEMKTFPQLPPLASDGLGARWPEWQKLAEAIKTGAKLGDFDKDVRRRGMAADLLYAKGDQKALLTLIAGETGPAFRQRLEADFMARYDRLCDSSLYFPGDALFLRNSTVYRFDTPIK